MGIGLLLLATAYFQINHKKSGIKKAKTLTISDGLILGVSQRFSILPGLFRSGLTVSALLLRRFDIALSLRLSFLMSLPIVFSGNIALNIKHFSTMINAFWGIIPSFLFGLLTIDLLLKIARKINFGHFVLLFGIVTILAVFL